MLALVISTAACGEKKEKTEVQAETINLKNDAMETIVVGTYTKKEGHVDGQADGIYTLKRNPEDGSLTKGKTVAEVVNPSFVRASEDGKFLFAVSELGEKDAESGFIYSFKITENDSLEQLSKLSTESFAPAHLALDQSGKYVFVSNYMGGVVMMYQVDADGTLTKQQRIDLENPEESHAHSVTISADNEYAYVADLGNDKIWIFDFDAEEGKLTPASPTSVALEEGAGPRHFTISENGSFAYSINELNSSISIFKVDGEGGLEIIQNISSLPEGFSDKNSAADIHLHPSGKFLYVSNRGHNSIASFSVEENSGELTALENFPTRGKTPRSFAVSPDGKHLYAANQDSNSVVVFKIDQNSGKLQPVGEPLEVMTPVSLEFIQ
ncbi:6-phosphogluconolactonase [Salinimicrobium marinum]|uniref:6-phosphogluconolactonase n=2 Tax=Salinimicrobium marinum TaxID=680283 RepID=A0A918VX45_9FLAO|nr:6-phosphogluconolactonase [Salinimicrobium marinum]